MLVTLGLGLTGCGADDGAATGPVAAVTPSSVDGTDVSRLLRSLVDDRIAPAHRALADRAAALAGVLRGCDDARAAAIDAWRATRLAWDAAAVYRFGPQVDAHLAANVDHWPLDTTAIDRVLAGDGPLAAVDVEALGSNARGLPIIESLLFDAAPLTGRRCEYAVGLAGAISLDASTVAGGFTAAAAGLAGADTAIVDLLSMLADAVYRVCDDQMAMPAAAPATVQQGAALMAMTDIRAQLDEVRAAFGAGIEPIVHARYAEAPDPLGPALDQAEQAIDAMGDDLAAAITTDPATVGAAVESCRNVRRTFATTVAAVLGVTLIIPIGDGD